MEDEGGEDNSINHEGGDMGRGYTDTYSGSPHGSSNSPQLSNISAASPFHPASPASPFHRGSPDSIRILSSASPNMPLANSPLFFDSQRSTPEGHVEASVAFNESASKPQGRRMSKARQSIVEGIAGAPPPIRQEHDTIHEDPNASSSQPPVRPASGKSSASPHPPTHGRSRRTSPVPNQQQSRPQSTEHRPPSRSSPRPPNTEHRPQSRSSTHPNGRSSVSPSPASHRSPVQVRYMEDTDSDEENPSKPEYLFYKIESRNVELLSQGVQTDLSCLENMTSSQPTSGPISNDLNDNFEKLKLGLQYGGSTGKF